MTDARIAEGRHPFGDGRTLEVRRLDPDRDAPLVHSWVRDERARFWGMTDSTEEQVREIYGFVDSLDTHHAYLVSVEGAAVALLQTYEPAADPVAEVYPVRDGDLGIHLLLAPSDAPEPGFTERFVAAAGAVVLQNADVRRVVVEPDAANDRALDRARRTGFDVGPQVDLEHKRAQLAFLDRATLEAMAAGIGAVGAGRS
ncbi:GNAT family N-acetyltransferase [Trujillonella endophytica]|uniref:Lysine N-acyltransferase MbtK n=1 Tax=Trujillonella endophytica TaxID=673521 RepID=A0A1H8WJH0_9ACTN|nr:GNAT family N-acetyltransferase [Trujillella endophytica]SEP27772.1 Acetyltransferase (GNAT) domain-containing protein [Trujillella endophytica]